MKQCQKWWNEEQTGTTGEEFLAKHRDTTQEQVLDALVEMAWRAALEMVLKEREARGDKHLKCVFDMIEAELES